MQASKSCLIRSRIANVTYSINRIYPTSRKIGPRLHHEHWAVAVRAVSGEGTNWAERERRERARAGLGLLGPRGKEWGWVEGEWAREKNGIGEGDDGLASGLDWVRLGFGLGFLVLVFLSNSNSNSNKSI